MEALKNAYEARAKKVNKIENVKALKTPKEAYEKLEYYAQNGYDSIAEEDKGYFFKCFGIFDRPATPKQFMIRVRIPGGHLNNAQAVAIGEVARDFGQDYIDITTRAQVELRYIDIENIPTILKKLHDVGISTFQTGVDNFRNIVNDPLDALGFDNILPSQDLLMRLQSTFLENWEWVSKLPRKFNTSISGSLSNRCNVYGHDCCFVLAQKDGVYGYNVYLGGKVGVLASSADIFLKDEEEVFKAFAAIISLFQEFGFRDNRNKNRLHFLIESVGMETFSAAIREKAIVDFASAGESLTQLDNSDADQGKIALRDKTFGVHVVVPSGVFTGSALLDAAVLSKEQGSGEIRFDIGQSLYIMGVKDTDALLKHKLFETYKSVNTPYFNNIIACAGTEHCPFGVIPNKPDAIEMAQYLSDNVQLDGNSRVRMYWSACVKGCGIHSLGDIGFEGCKAKIEGETVYGVHILVGGKLSGQSEEGHSVLKAVPLKYAKYYVESLASEYKRMKLPSESFEKFNDRVLSQYSRSAVGFMMILLAYLKRKNMDVSFGFRTDVACGKNENFEIFDIGTHLYYAVFNEVPYQNIESFKPYKSTKLAKVEHEDEILVGLIEKMLKEEDAAQAFSEILDMIKL